MCWLFDWLAVIVNQKLKKRGTLSQSKWLWPKYWVQKLAVWAWSENKTNKTNISNNVESNSSLYIPKAYENQRIQSRGTRKPAEWTKEIQAQSVSVKNSIADGEPKQTCARVASQNSGHVLVYFNQWYFCFKLKQILGHLDPSRPLSGNGYQTRLVTMPQIPEIRVKTGT